MGGRPRTDYLSYHQSIAAELIAIQNRVRYFIKDAHWGEDGRYKEVLLMNYLKKVLPKNASVGTGFVRNKDHITSQIDLIVYDNSVPTLFSEGDFVVVIPESVFGIIEVKSKSTATNSFSTAIKKANENGEKINKSIFNGIFGFDNSIRFSENQELAPLIDTSLRQCNGFLNHISFGPNYFMKYWEKGNPEDNDDLSCFSFYRIPELSFGYFISNLIEVIHIKSKNRGISKDLKNFLYPIDGGKETKRIMNIDIKIMYTHLL